MENTALSKIQEVDQLLPTIEVLKNMKQVADYMVSAGMLPPGYKKGEDLMVVGLRGRELGVPMGQAIQGMFPMKGRIGYMGGFLLSMVKTRLPFSDIRIKESTKEKCILMWKRNREDEFQTEEYSMEEVEACHYNSNPMYGADGKQKMDASGHLMWIQKTPWGDPKNMLYWRCATRTINRWFSDVFGSPVYTADELQDSEVIDITPAGKAAASVPYSTQANTPETPAEPAPVVTEIEDAVVIPSDEVDKVSGVAPIVEGQVPISEPAPPDEQEKPAKMTTNMVDAIVTQFEKDIFTAGVTKRFIDDKFEDLKKTGLPGKVLTTCFNLKKKRIDEVAVKK